MLKIMNEYKHMPNMQEQEINSLCYNVGSMYQKYDGLIIITTSVDINKSNLAVQLIKTCLKEMKTNISDEELVNAKALAKTSLNMTNDNIGRIVDNAYYQNISALDELDVRLDKFDKVSINDVKKVAEKTSISTIYVLYTTVLLFSFLLSYTITYFIL